MSVVKINQLNYVEISVISDSEPSRHFIGFVAIRLRIIVKPCSFHRIYLCWRFRNSTDTNGDSNNEFGSEVDRDEIRALIIMISPCHFFISTLSKSRFIFFFSIPFELKPSDKSWFFFSFIIYQPDSVVITVLVKFMAIKNIGR